MKKLDYNVIKWDELFYYDETSPTFLRWKVDRWSGKGGCILEKAADDIAGYIDVRGYVRTGLLGEMYLNHRIIWCLHHGSIDPEKRIDHINGDRADNNIRNLRLVSQLVNIRNQKLRRTNTSGVTGVRLTINNYYVACWYDLESNIKQKYFSVTKLGEAEAFRLACEYRKHMIEELNAQGAGYTERHGVKENAHGI